MKPDPKQLALMISLIGLGLTAAQPVRAEAPLFVYAEPVLPPEAGLDALPDPARPMAAWLAEIPMVQPASEAPVAAQTAPSMAEPEDRLGRFIEQVVRPDRAPALAEPPSRAVAAAVVPPQALPSPEPLPPVQAPAGADATDEAAPIVVATASDTVLHGLASLIGAPGDAAGRDDAWVVDTQSEKVLATLAQVLPKPAAPAEHVFGPVAKAERLDAVRGGFTTPTGLQFTFGIERAVYVNGDLVATTTLNLSNLKQDIENRVAQSVGGLVVVPQPSQQSATAQNPPASPSLAAGSEAAPLVTAPVPASASTPAAQSASGVAAPVMVIHTGGPLGVVQIGPGNSLPAGGLGGSALGTVIQNTLNDQMIQNVLTVNATVNSLQVLKSFDVQSAVRSAIHDALRR